MEVVYLGFVLYSDTQFIPCTRTYSKRFILHLFKDDPVMLRVSRLQLAWILFGRLQNQQDSTGEEPSVDLKTEVRISLIWSLDFY